MRPKYLILAAPFLVLGITSIYVGIGLIIGIVKGDRAAGTLILVVGSFFFILGLLRSRAVFESYWRRHPSRRERSGSGKEEGGGFPSPLVDQTEERTTEHAILEMSEELYSQLGLARLAPAKIGWLNPGRYDLSMGKGLASSVVNVRSDKCDFHMEFEGRQEKWLWWLALPKTLEGKLRAEDYIPLVAVSLIYQRKLRRFLLLAAAVYLIPLLLFMGLLANSASATPGFSNPIGFAFVFGFVFWLPFSPFLAVISRRITRWRAFLADRRAAVMAGGTSLLSVLQRIDGLAFPDLERRKRMNRVRSLFSSYPSITDRIRHLSP